ncbi:amino acid ABC transporter permease [Jeotgalibaca ciconiae]|uniref:Amino acid ABC transporter permease n=1 Tax=Jeotgalibaca ciconiae TaxID=2496265 RepID=A0A3Q9BMU5_9LACT|nr:amino acid ABC transporter permease [Jeotgalibaca ciconiae]AZP04991.1 amino acid ABC transporter permease [Jeotgalibaca ciconiae]HJB24234.1 amino acid ABC transporter permease [Candidatus Jeotgalibaca pullicola]
MQDLGISILFQGRNFVRLLEGLWVTINISLISVSISILLGIILGMVMTIKNPVITIFTKFYLEFVRVMPQLVLLFLVYFGLTRAFNINLSGELSSIIVFSLWGTAEMGDLVRGALISIPKHQYESGMSLGLTKLQVYQYVIIPQTVRRLLPLALNLVTRMIKTTSLIVLIGVVEVVKVGQQIIESSRLTDPNASLWIYGTIFFLYFLICYPLSLLATRLERKWKN